MSSTIVRLLGAVAATAMFAGTAMADEDRMG